MTGLRRTLGLFAALTCLSAPSFAARADEISDLYREGVDLLQKGRDAEALERFTRVLALQPSHEEAYRLWKSTEHEILVDLLVKGGQYEIVGKRFLELARVARAERRDDADAIRELLRNVDDADVLARKRAIRELASSHGEYAVSYMLHPLADQANDDRRVYFMQALTEMGLDVVFALSAALEAEDEYLRRNVALVLGYIGDPRAAGKLTWLADNDPDAGVRMAAKQAAIRCGSGGEALPLLLQLGDDLHHRRSTVLSPFMASDVVWRWKDGELGASAVPRYLYADELSKDVYYDALRADPSSLDARAGIVRAYVSQLARIGQRMEAGLDTSGADEQLAEASVAIHTAGVEALDRALQWSVSTGDVTTGIELARVLADHASEGTAGLWAAFQGGDGSLAAEAAVALGRIAHANDLAATPAVVAALGRAVATEVLRIAVVIDGDAGRGSALARELESKGLLVNHWDSGAKGLNLLRQVPGVDAILVADVLPDLTVDQVLDEIARDERLAEVPLFLISSDAERGSELYGERTAAVVSGAADADGVHEAMSARLGGERGRANRLAAAAATALADLARGVGRTDLSPAVPALASALDGPPRTEVRPDEVTVPTMRALGAAGGEAQAAALAAVLADGARSDESRMAAASAIGAIAARSSMVPSSELFRDLAAILTSDASLEVRRSAAAALGRMHLSPAQRAELARSARVDVSE